MKLQGYSLITTIVIVPHSIKSIMLFSSSINIPTGMPKSTMAHFLGFKIPQPQTNQASTATQMASSLFRLVVFTTFLDFDFPISIPPYHLTLLSFSSILHHLLSFLPPFPSADFTPLTTTFSSCFLLFSLRFRRRHCSTGASALGVAVFLSKFHGFDDIGVEK